MKTQRILIGAAVGTAIAGIGFLLFHPSGKKMRSKAVDLGLDAADKLIDYVRKRDAQYKATAHSSAAPGMDTEVPGSL
jgi:gas vesicle protein